MEQCETKLIEIQKSRYGSSADIEPIRFDIASLRGIELPKLVPIEKINFAIIDRLMQSIALLHSVGWYHNDIHAHNILMGLDGNPRIIDFGEAEERPLDRITGDYEHMLNLMA